MKPRLQALLVADRVYQDAATGKKIIVGVFQNLQFIKKENFDAEVERREGKLPIMAGGYQAGSPFAYASLTDVRGEQPLVLRYVDLSEDKAIFQCEFKVMTEDPLSPIEVIIPLPTLPAVKAGVFALELLWHDDPLGSYRIKVQELQMGGEGNAS